MQNFRLRECLHWTPSIYSKCGTVGTLNSRLQLWQLPALEICHLSLRARVRSVPFKIVFNKLIHHGAFSPLGVLHMHNAGFSIPAIYKVGPSKLKVQPIPMNEDHPSITRGMLGPGKWMRKFLIHMMDSKHTNVQRILLSLVWLNEKIFLRNFSFLFENWVKNITSILFKTEEKTFFFILREKCAD